MYRNGIGLATAIAIAVNAIAAEMPGKTDQGSVPKPSVGTSAASSEARPASTAPAKGKPGTTSPAVARPSGQASAQPEPVVVLKSGSQEHGRLVYHLKAVPAAELARTIGELLRGEQRLPRSDSQAAKVVTAGSVVIVPETIGNHLLVSGPPAAVEEVQRLLDELDRPMGLVLLEMSIGERPMDDTRPVAQSPKPESKPSSATGPAQFRLVEKPPQMNVVGRVRLTTLDNQPAFVQLGSRVPRITGTSKVSTAGRVNSISMENVGLILGVTPRITPDREVVMEIDAEQSQLAPEQEGVPISVTENQMIRAPRIDNMTAQTTVRVPDGQTIVLASVARQDKPGKELLIVVTAHIIGTAERRSGN